MTAEKFLEAEFENFIIKFDKKDSSEDFNFETPPFELETIEPIQFNTKLVLNKQKCIIMPIQIIGNAPFSKSLEIFNNINPVYIKFKRLEEIKRSQPDFPKFKLTTISTNCAMNCIIRSVPKLERGSCFNNLEMYYKQEFEIGIKAKDKRMREFKNFILNVPNLDKRAFWIDLTMVNLNPIGPKFVKNISYRMNNNDNLLISTKESFESLREAEIQPLTPLPCTFVMEKSEAEAGVEAKAGVEGDFIRKCIINIDTLQNDLLIETLQLIKWKIYERPEIFKGIQMFQVSKSSVLFLIKIENLKTSIEIIKTIKNAKVIIEIEDEK